MLLGQELKFKYKLCNLKLGTFFSAFPGLGAFGPSARVAPSFGIPDTTKGSIHHPFVVAYRPLFYCFAVFPATAAPHSQRLQSPFSAIPSLVQCFYFISPPSLFSTLVPSAPFFQMSGRSPVPSNAVYAAASCTLSVWVVTLASFPAL